MSVSNRRFGLMSAALALAVLVGCSGKSNPSNGGVYAGDTANGGIYAGDTANGGGGTQRYTLTTKASPLDGGSVLRSPDKTTYIAGQTVALRAAPNFGYELDGWSDGTITSKDSVLRFAMNGDKEVTANFRTVSSHNLNVAVTPDNGGKVVRDPEQATYQAGAQVVLRAIPNPDYEFTGWSGASTSTDSVIKVTVNTYKTFVANFKPCDRPYYLTLVMAGNEYCRGKVLRSPEQTNYDAGTRVTLTAIPRDNGECAFTGWSGPTNVFEESIKKAPNPVTIVMNSSVVIEAYFNIISYVVTVEILTHGVTGKAIGGTVSGSGRYEIGKTAVLTATPNDGYEFDGWSGESASELMSTISPDVTRITMNGNKNIIASFARVYTLTINNSTGGTVSCEPNQKTYRSGTQVRVTAKPNTLHKFVSWDIAGWPSETPMPTLTNAKIAFPINADITLTPKFEVCLLGCNTASSPGE